MLTKQDTILLRISRLWLCCITHSNARFHLLLQGHLWQEPFDFETLHTDLSLHAKSLDCCIKPIVGIPVTDTNKMLFQTSLAVTLMLETMSVAVKAQPTKLHELDLAIRETEAVCQSAPLDELYACNGPWLWQCTKCEGAKCASWQYKECAKGTTCISAVSPSSPSIELALCLSLT